MAGYDIKRYSMLYFAYGNNMDEDEMKRKGKCPSSFCLGTGYLINKKLVFTKESTKWKLAANITSSYGDKVYGVLYDIINPPEWESLKNAEKGYHHVNVRVRVLPDRHIVSAVTYEAEPGAVVEEGPTAREYLEKLIKGAREHHLPEEYIRFLESVPVVEGE